MGKLLPVQGHFTDTYPAAEAYDYHMMEDASTEEWEKLEGTDIFGKFSSLLSVLYPSVS